jgi:Carboxypeptidase regulatory-like domain
MNLVIQRALPALVVLFLSTLAPLGAAESTTAALSGTVRSAEGTAIAGAHVAAASPSGSFEATSDARGAFRLLALTPDTYTISVDARGYTTAVERGVTVGPGSAQMLAVRLISVLTTIGSVRSTVTPIQSGATSERFVIAASPIRLDANASGLAAYSAGTVQGTIAAVPGVSLDTFGNAILRGGKVDDVVFDYDSVPIPQGLIAEPGGNIVGAQLATTGVASTATTLAGFTNQGDNALGGVVDQIPLTGIYPSRTSIALTDGAGALAQRFALTQQWASPDMRWRYAFATTLASEYFAYGDGHTFYPSEAATYGLSLQTRGTASFAANVHDRLTPNDDLSFVVLTGEANYQQYASPYAGETAGAFDGAVTSFPGETDPNAAVTYASGLRGTYDIAKVQWLHTGAHATSRLQLYQTQFGSVAGGPFWDDLSFPDGVISLSAVQGGRESGTSFDVDQLASDQHHLVYGIEYRVNNSFLYQVVPTADETIDSNPTLFSGLAYLGDTWSITQRLKLAGTARWMQTHIVPSDGSIYDVGAIDPHAALAYRIGSDYTARVTYDHTTVAPKPLEADRTDSANPAPFVALAPETASNLTYAIEGTGRTRFRFVYYNDREQNRIDVLPFNFRSALAAGENPDGVGVPTNAGSSLASGFDLWVQNGPLALTIDTIHGQSSSASQFAYNDLNAAAVAVGHLFPLGYVPAFTATLSYEFAALHKRLRITPSISYQSGFPYGNGTMVWTFDPTTGKPVQVPNDNYVNPGYNYYFLSDPSMPFNATTNPYIGSLGTPEGADPNSLHAPGQTLVSLHIEGDITKRLTAAIDISNLFATSTPTAYQGNPYLIGPPGYTGNNPLYGIAYQNAAGYAQPYVLGNGIPTNDGVHQAVPWNYGTAGYVPQGYPLARTVQFSLRYTF